MREILFRAKRKNWHELSKEEWWIEENRTHKNDKRELAAEQELREYDERSGNNDKS